MSTYYTVLKGFWDELSSYTSVAPCSWGATNSRNDILEEQRLMQFLIGLNEVYSTVQSNILLIEPLPTVTKAYALILQDERQRSLSSPTTQIPDQSALAAISRSSSKPKYHCDFCGADSYTKSHCMNKDP